MDGEEQRVLKRAFCEFFMKLLPSIVDPMQIIRQRWHNFRDILLDENKSAQEVLAYVKVLKFALIQLDGDSGQENQSNKPSSYLNTYSHSRKVSEQHGQSNQHAESPIQNLGQLPHQSEKPYPYPRSPAQYLGQSPAPLGISPAPSISTRVPSSYSPKNFLQPPQQLGNNLQPLERSPLPTDRLVLLLPQDRSLLHQEQPLQPLEQQLLPSERLPLPSERPLPIGQIPNLLDKPSIAQALPLIPLGLSPQTSSQPLRNFAPKLYLDAKTKKDMFVKQPSSKKLLIKPQNASPSKREKQEDGQVERYDLKSISQIPTHDFTLPTWTKPNNSFPLNVKESILTNITSAVKIFRYNSRTLGCVYDRSFEINTSEFTDTDADINKKHLQETAAQLASQQDMQFFRNTQRQKSLKAYSIYSKNKPAGLEFINQNDKNDDKKILI